MSIVGVVWWRWTFVLSILIVHTHFVSGLQYSSTDFLIRAGVPQFSLCTSQRQVSASASTLRQTSTQLKAVEEGTSSRPPPPLVGELQLHTREVRTSAMNDASARLQRDSAIHAWRERLAFLKQARAQLDDRFLRVSSDVRDPKRSVLRSLASLPRHDLAETSGKLKSTLQTRVRVRVEMYPSPPSSLQSQPCPAWSPGVSNTTCRDGFDIARSEAECDKYVPVPGLDRSKSSVAVAATLPTSSPSQRMYCVDERGVFDPPSFALCSLPAWNVTEPSSLSCSVCSSGHFGSNCTACTSSCLRNGRCNDSLSGDGSCTCDEGWSGAECDACLPLHFGASCTPCPSTCGSNGHCNDTAAGDGTCICSEGWEGGECDCVVGSRLLRCLSPPSVWTGVSQTPVKLLHPGGNQDDELAYGGPTLSSSGLLLAAASPYHSNKGVVLVWERNSTYLSFSNSTPAVLADANGQSGDRLGLGGLTLSASGLTLAAASPYYSGGVSNAGCVLVWERGSNATNTSFVDVEPVRLLDPDRSADDLLGSGGPCLSGNALVLAAASPQDDGGAGVGDVGSVLVWTRANTSISFADVTPVKLFDPNALLEDYMGMGGPSLSYDGLVMGVGSHHTDDTGIDGGSVLVWERENSSVTFSSIVPSRLLDPNGDSSDMMGAGGACLAGNGLVLAAASHGDNENGVSSGSLLVWERQNTTIPFSSITPVKLLDPNGGVGSMLGGNNNEDGVGGCAVSSDGLTLAAASAFDAMHGVNSGAVLLWERESTSASFLSSTPARLSDPNGAVSDQLGLGGPALSGNGRVLSVGAPNDGEMGSNSGSVLVWESICEAGYAPPLCLP